MRGKAALIVGLATGYVLGTRDGRERYEQIKSQATRVWQDPRVQEKASQATDLAKDKAPVLKDKVASKVSSSSGNGSDGLSGHGSEGFSDTGVTSTDRPVGAVDEDAIVVTPPSPSPLAPGPTSTGSASQTSGGLDG
jgi:hypothetical protein